MRLIDIVTKDCNTLKSHLIEQEEVITNILTTYNIPITNVMMNRYSYPMYICPFSDFEWGASCHGTIPRMLTNHIPAQLKKKGVNPKTGRVFYYVDPQYSYTVIELMTKVQVYADEGAYTYFTDVYNKDFYVKKVPWTWYELAKDIQKRSHQLPLDKNALSQTETYFKALSNSIKDIELERDIGYPSLLHDLPTGVAITLTRIPAINSTFKLFAHFEVHTHR